MFQWNCAPDVFPVAHAVPCVGSINRCHATQGTASPTNVFTAMVCDPGSNNCCLSPKMPPITVRRMSTPLPRDPTPFVGSATDIAPLGRSGQKPGHELTAEEDNVRPIAWGRIAQLPEFKSLLAKKAAFILPMTFFFVAYYFALPLLVGYAPDLMAKKVAGNINIAYLFALSQFFMAWAIAAIYVRTAARWDRTASEIVNKVTAKEWHS